MEYYSLKNLVGKDVALSGNVHKPSKDLLMLFEERYKNRAALFIWVTKERVSVFFAVSRHTRW